MTNQSGSQAGKQAGSSNHVHNGDGAIVNVHQSVVCCITKRGCVDSF